MPEYAAPALFPHAPVLLAGQALEDLRSAWLEACLAYDEPHAEAALTQALAQFTVESVCLGLLVPGLAEVGERWYRGEVTPHQEHFASELAQRRVESLLAATPNPVRAGRILIACPPQELHSFVPLVLTLLLRRRGWAVTYLGANTPTAQFEQTLEAVRPRLCVMAAQTLHAAGQLLPLAELLVVRGIPLAFGGTAFVLHPTLARRIPGFPLANRLEESLEAIEALMASPPPVPLPTPEDPALGAARLAFDSIRPNLDAQLLSEIPSNVTSAEPLRKGIENLSQAIADGLTLGDLDLVTPELTWLEGLLANAHVPTPVLTAFLHAYARAAADQLGPEGGFVVEWLNRLTTDRPTQTSGG